MRALESTIEMARKARTNGRQIHPSGPLDTVDDDWKKGLRADMKDRGWDQKDLAREIPCSPASITNMFKPGPRQIRFKRRIEELFGRAPSPKFDEVRRRIEAKLSRLSLDDAETVARLVDSLAVRR